MTVPRTVIVAALAVLLIVTAWCLIGPAPVAAVGGLSGVGLAVRQRARQASREEGDHIIGGLGPPPDVLRQEAVNEDARIAAEVAGMSIAELQEYERARGRG